MNKDSLNWQGTAPGLKPVGLTPKEVRELPWPTLPGLSLGLEAAILGLCSRSFSLETGDEIWPCGYGFENQEQCRS